MLGVAKVVKRQLFNILCCRMKKSSSLLLAMCLLFLIANFYFLFPLLVKDMQDRNRKSIKQIEEKNTFTELVQKKGEFNELDSIVTVEEKQINLEEKNKLPATAEYAAATIEDIRRHERVAKHENRPDTTISSNQVVGKRKIAVLVVSCNRPSAVRRCLQGIFKYKPVDTDIPVIVSQDCGDEATAEVIKSFGDKVKYVRQPELGDVKNVPHHMVRWMGYYKISRHYKWALGEVFSQPDIDSVIIVEDDLDIAPDFFDYFLATRPLLDQDPSLFCISAWNDNGKSDLIDESAIDLLYRTDFFPGLGWLLSRKIWEEFQHKWPLGFWDDWIRAPEQRQGRSCIRPEISRTRTFGRVGVSLGQFYDQYLKFIKLNDKPFPFRDYDMSYLLKENYDSAFLNKVSSSPKIQMDNSEGVEGEAVRLPYYNNNEFERIARQYGLMSDLKAGVPRTAYKGVVTFYNLNRRIYIAPAQKWTKYDG